MSKFFEQNVKLTSLWVLSSFLLTTGVAQENAETPAAKVAHKTQNTSEADQKQIDKLQRYLTGTRWTGQFTVTGKELNDLTPEYYEITKAVKTPDEDYWMLSVRIKYGEHDSTLDLPPIQIKWAGETPVITVDQVTIPGFGTFDARVVIRKNKYAGTWSHDAVGGHLFGSIERIKPDTEQDKANTSDK